MNIVEFTDHLYGRGKAERTVREYAKWVRRLTVWAADHGHQPDTIPAHLVRRWADDTVPASRESRKQARTALGHYWRAVGRTDAPWEAIRTPRKPRTRARPLDDAEAALLRDTAILHGGRQGTAVLLLAFTAARPGEVAAMRWDGVGRDRICWWREKVADWHEIPLHPILSTALDRYRPPHAEGHLFRGNNGRAHVTATTVWEWTREIARVAGVEAVTPRRLRATAGTRVLAATGSIDAVASLLGHRDVNVTRAHYAATPWDHLEAAVDAL